MAVWLTQDEESVEFSHIIFEDGGRLLDQVRKMQDGNLGG